VCNLGISVPAFAAFQSNLSLFVVRLQRNSTLLPPFGFEEGEAPTRFLPIESIQHAPAAFAASFFGCSGYRNCGA
jgi:hypothetical protein